MVWTEQKFQGNNQNAGTPGSKAFVTPACLAWGVVLRD